MVLSSYMFRDNSWLGRNEKYPLSAPTSRKVAVYHYHTLQVCPCNGDSLQILTSDYGKYHPVYDNDLSFTR